MNGQPALSTLLLLTGPTAVGKSAVALELAQQLGGEIVSVDSMQVYRGLDIGTAKPSPAERQRVPHHLVDVVELSEPFDAAQFARRAWEAVRDIQARGRVPILCGGTGLYFKAFLEGVGTAPPADPALRAELERTPLPELLRELAERDPTLFAQIDRRNPRRVVRALEVIRLTGRPFSAQRAAWAQATVSPLPVNRRAAVPAARKDHTEARAAMDGDASSPRRVVPKRACWEAERLPLIGLVREADDLRRRIDARVEEMFRRGLVQETAALLERGLAQNPVALQAIGYRQVAEHLRGERSLAETIALVKQRTRQFARRQMIWFRKHAQVTWLEVAPNEPPTHTAERVLALWRGWASSA